MAHLSPGGTTKGFDKILDRPAISVEDISAYIQGPNVWRRGRPLSEPPSILEIREVTSLEAQAARVVTETGQMARMDLKAIRARHHELARLMVAGVGHAEIARVLGMGQGTISVLTRSPAFQALLAHYHSIRDSEALGIAEKLKQTSLDVLLLLSDKLQENGEDLTVEGLRKLAETLLDRSGFSPVQKQVTLHGGLSPSDIAEIRKQHATPQPKPKANPGSPIRAIDYEGPLFASNEGNESRGAGL